MVQLSFSGQPSGRECIPLFFDNSLLFLETLKAKQNEEYEEHCDLSCKYITA